MKQLLVLDLDGTLLRNDKTVSDKTVGSLIEFKNCIWRWLQWFRYDKTCRYWSGYGKCRKSCERIC